MRVRFFLFLLFLGFQVQAQSLIFDNFRMNQLLNDSLINHSLNFRTTSFSTLVIEDSLKFLHLGDNSIESIRFLPFEINGLIQPSRPYAWGDRLMKPAPGSQFYISTGFRFHKGHLNIEFQPELVVGFLNDYSSLPREYSDDIVIHDYYFFNRGDQPEEFGKKTYSEFWWGQSKVSFQFGSFEMGVSTQNFWWGPGQWNSLIFSNNAKGFPHATLNTIKPAKTFIGNFEGQFLVGKLNSSNQFPTLNQEWNNRFFSPLSEEWRYLNAILFSYNPKWIPGLSAGFSRTVQLYNNFLGNTFLDYFPIFQALQKEKYFENGNSVGFDAKNQSQQVAVFGRFVIPKAKSELYFEFGRRDHAFNWRDFILSPEHARAYNFGFVKLFDLAKSNRFFQVRGEATQQHESINRYIRYNHLDGGDTWHTNGQARGFTNEGQALGVGTGLGSNVQTLEFSILDGYNKAGLLFQRLENNQAFYYRSFLFNEERNPWIDFSFGILFDKRFGKFLLSSKLQMIHAINYQWQTNQLSSSEFPKGINHTSFISQASLIYFLKDSSIKVRR